jgi:HNH endonuclease
MKVCRECGRTFLPSSRHLRCTACRSRDLCSCGNRKQLKSSTCWECRPQQLEFNRNRKGGRTRHHAGYLMVRVPEHPRARCNNGYVFEHILVMERLLGRHLDPNESVHHRNGIRDDNRPVNLELWIRPQPAGIRATDAVEWAKEILYRYGSLAASRNAQTRA